MERWIKNIGLVGLFIGLFIPSGLVNAANGNSDRSPYGMSYSGGTPLSAENVHIDSSMSGLTELIKSGKSKITRSNSNKWLEGYYKGTNGTCSKYSFAKVSATETIDRADDVYYVMSNNLYDAKVEINKVTLENPSEILSEGQSFAIGVHSETSGYISVGDRIYSDAGCTTEYDGIKAFSLSENGRVFVETNLKLYKKGTDEVFVSDKLYFGLTDIDAAQSYKILNSSNLMSPSNMFAVSEDVLQDTTENEELKNMYVADGHYIYSQFGDVARDEKMQSNYKSNAFVKANPEAQVEGLDVVFGFAGVAGSGVQYYARQYSVEYKSDENGEITGISKEDIISGNYPSGSNTSPKETYELNYWTADKDVTLEDGTVIKAGELLTPEQVESVVVHENLVFTAYHDTIPKIPDTGAFTGGTNAMGITTSIVAVMAGGLLVWFIPKLNHKKVKFDKH